MNRFDFSSIRRLVQVSLGRTSLCAAVGLAIAGCSGRNRPASPPPNNQPAVQSPIGQGMTEWAADVRKSALEFELTAGELQNTPLSRQRPQLRQAFGQLSELLPKLAGPARTGVFSHQYSVVTQVRDQLANRPERLSDDALVDNGLIAAYNALRDLSYNQFYADEDLTKQIDALGKSVGMLVRTRGAEHAIQVSDAVTTMSGVLTKMAATLHARNSEAADPGATPPATTEPAATQPGSTEQVPAESAPPTVPPPAGPAPTGPDAPAAPQTPPQN